MIMTTRRLKISMWTQVIRRLKYLLAVMFVWLKKKILGET